MLLFEYFDELQERFFTWCDNVLRDYLDREGAMLKKWWPRKNPDGSYELVFKLIACDKALSKIYVPIPEEYHELLEREYFINHPPDEDETD